MTEREELAAFAKNAAEAFGPWTEYRTNLLRIAELLRDTPGLPPAPPAGFVRVRAAVAVGRHGGYGVCGWIDEKPSGWSRAEDEVMADDARDMTTDEDPLVSFVTFDAPMPPEHAEIVGKID